MNTRNAGSRSAEIADSRTSSERPRSLSLARRVRALRSKGGMTLKELSARSGISISALSKLENGQLSPTYENIVRLARGLSVDITALFADDIPAAVMGRRSITCKGAGVRCETANYDYEMLCTDLARKQMVPLLARVKAKEIKAFGPLIAHEGEEVVYVVSGKIVLHTEYYEPRLLETGDCAYFDSTMQHACVTQGVEDAVVFWVCSSGTVNELVRRASEDNVPLLAAKPALKSQEKTRRRRNESSPRR
jgi:transcriptional regulator with XRE-family HTH domain